MKPSKFDILCYSLFWVMKVGLNRLFLSRIFYASPSRIQWDKFWAHYSNFWQLFVLKMTKSSFFWKYCKLWYFQTWNCQKWSYCAQNLSHGVLINNGVILWVWRGRIGEYHLKSEKLWFNMDRRPKAGGPYWNAISKTEDGIPRYVRARLTVFTLLLSQLEPKRPKESGSNRDNSCKPMK